MSNNQIYDAAHSNDSWFLRFIKGIFIGSGFIVPGVSGGALAAVFGLYEQIIRFLANITKDFVKNVVYFIPVGLGGLAGLVLFSWGVSFFLENYETIVLWFFVGAIVGTLPALWRQAGEQGRSQKDIIISVVTFILGFILLQFGASFFTGSVGANFFTWMICGFLIALGILVPGLSPSNFILYMGLYEQMSDGFKTLDLSIIIPIAIGGALTIFGLAKFFEKIFERHYSPFFHFIFGIVIASTLMIIPIGDAYAGFGFMQYALCVLMLALGTWVGWWMTNLEEKYK